MADLEELLGFDASDPEQRLALKLVEQDRQLLDALVQARRATTSQEALAEKLGISQPAVQQFERRDGDPRLSTIRRYALALGLVVTHKVERDDSVLDALLRDTLALAFEEWQEDDVDLATVSSERLAEASQRPKQRA